VAGAVVAFGAPVVVAVAFVAGVVVPFGAPVVVAVAFMAGVVVPFGAPVVAVAFATGPASSFVLDDVYVEDEVVVLVADEVDVVHFGHLGA
jgi:hypothetical protein